MTDYEKIAENLRGKFAQTVRKMCADDNFNCDDICDGNILTSKCIVFQAADAINKLQAEIKSYSAELKVCQNALDSTRMENERLKAELKKKAEQENKSWKN